METKNFIVNAKNTQLAGNQIVNYMSMVEVIGNTYDPNQPQGLVLNFNNVSNEFVAQYEVGKIYAMDLSEVVTT